MAELLYWLKHYDSRFHPLLTVIKIWAQVTGLTSHVWPPPRDSLSSFMITMLLVFYLQSVKVLPPLESIHVPNMSVAEQVEAAYSSDGTFLKDWSDVQRSDNEMKPVQLLVEFFQFYLKYPFNKPAVINLLTGTMNMDSSCASARKGIHLKDPYNESYNICKNLNEMGVLRFRDACREALEVFDNCLAKNRSSYALTLLLSAQKEQRTRRKAKVSIERVVSHAFQDRRNEHKR